jgi:hypothetical protein
MDSAGGGGSRPVKYLAERAMSPKENPSTYSSPRFPVVWRYWIMGREFSEQTEGLVLARSRSVASSGTLPQWNGERPCRRHRHTAALTLAVSKPSKHSPARNKRIELATRANPSCASGILFESILRSNDSQNGFHTAKTRNGSSRASIGAEGLVPVHPQHSQRGRARASGMVAERGMSVQVPANATREPPAFASARLCRRGSMISPG